MSLLKKVLLGTALAVAFGAPALTQSLIGDGEPWELRENMAYTVHPSGKMRILPIGQKGMAMMTKHAKPVPRGTVLFTRNGQLYMMRAGGAYDRAGNWMGHH